MNKKNIKKINNTRIKRSAFFVILILFIIWLIIGNKKDKYKELTVLLNNQLIEMSEKVIIDDNENIFFSKEDVQKYFDETIYYNEVEKELITTYNTHVALLKINDEYAVINDENVKLQVYLQEIDGIIYIPIKELQKVYDIEIEYSKKNNRIIIDSTLKEKIEATIKKKTKVNEKKGFFNGKKIENLIIGDKVIILGEEGKYRKIRTSMGNIGYVKQKNISDEKKVRDNFTQDKKEINVLKNYSNISGVYENVQVDDSKLNVVIPTFFYIDENQKVLDKTTSTTATYAIYKNWADNNNLQIMPVLTNNESVSKTLLSFSERSTIIKTLLNYVTNYNYVGININFNSIDDLNSFYRFVLELYPRFKEKNLKVAVTLDHNLERSRLENITDYIIEK